MKPSPLVQYCAAGIMGIGCLAAQIANIYSQLGGSFQSAKQYAMFKQVIEALFGDTVLLLHALSYLFFAVALHVGIPLIALRVLRAAVNNLGRPKLDVLGLPFVGLVLLLMAMWNRRMNPTSLAFEHVELLMVQSLSPLLFWGATLFACLAAGAAILPWLARRPLLTAVSTLGLIAAGFVEYAPREIYSGKQPNIIVLGVDSLRPDFVHAYGFPSPDLTPALNSMLGEMVVVQGATTPTARTFVSYMSLLTGKNPINHGARFNLFPWEHIKDQPSISKSLGELGYHRLLAMDESRFANFPPIMEFDQFSVPQIGALDFLIGSSYDLMATNLAFEVPLVGPSLGYVFGNRAAYRTYDPEHHSKKIAAAVKSAPVDAPLFLVSHLCLPHWPYLGSNIWAPDDSEKFNHLPGFEDIPTSYFRAISASDAQLSSTMEILRSTGRLENALVFIISDHGESFSAQRDVLTDIKAGQLVGSFGHGGFILSTEQNSIVLSFQHYTDGSPAYPPRKIDADASIIDIAPSIAEVLHLKTGDYEGLSLVPLASSETRLEQRPRFLESGIRSLNVERADIDETAVANEMSDLYRVTNDLRFELLPEQVETQLKMKQRGVIFGDRIVASMPRAFSEGFGDCWAVASKQPRTVHCDSFPSPDPAIHAMQRMVCDYFERDGDFSETWCRADTQEKV